MFGRDVLEFDSPDFHHFCELLACSVIRSIDERDVLSKSLIEPGGRR